MILLEFVIAVVIVVTVAVVAVAVAVVVSVNEQVHLLLYVQIHKNYLDYFLHF